MRIGGSITRRVVLVVMATVAVFLGAQAVVAYLAMHRQEDRMVSDMLHQEIKRIVHLTLAPGLTPSGRLQSAGRVSAWLTRGDEGRDQLPPALRDLPVGERELLVSGETWNAGVVDTEDGRLTVVVDATKSERRVHQFGLVLVGLWLAGVAATAFIARFVASLAVSPFVEATANIARWAPERETPLEPGGDEAKTLVEAFNRFRDASDEALARERQFAADLDHEIRTPLTAIRTDAELCGVEGPLTEAQRLRLKRIAELVETTIETARTTRTSASGEPIRRSRFDLLDAVRQACTPLADRAVARALRIELDIPAGLEIEADRQALIGVCRNVVANAIEHAAPATLTIRGDARGLDFADDGPGIEAASLPFVFDRYHRGHRADADAGPAGPRRGLGLAIARRIGDAQGWRLTVASPRADGPGTVFRFDLAAD